MKRKIWHFFEIAAELATKKKDILDKRAYFLGAIGIRQDGTIVASINGSSTSPKRQAHCEYRLASKLDFGATIYVARVRKGDGSFAMAKPCRNCQKVLRSKKVKKVYYTISQNEYGVLYL